MSQRFRQVLLAAVGAAAAAAAAWNFATSRPAGAADGDMEQTALCAACGHYLDPIMQSELQRLAPADGPRPAVAPHLGPGYSCPQCGRPALYQNPITCPECGRRFLLSPGPDGVPVARCPGCGWER